MFIDTHTHLTDSRFDEDRESVINNLKDDMIDFVIEIGYDYENSLKVFELAQNYDNIYCAIGIHPHDSKNATKENYQHFKELAKNKKVVAIGEIGLDYFYDLSDRETQKKVFVEQLQLADELKLPVILHLRDAYEDMFNILKENKHLLNNGALLHCYSGSAEMLDRFLELGLFIALGGAITFKTAKKEEVIKKIPLNRLLTETDCPYLTPEPNRGKRNEPKNVKFVAEKIATVKQIEVEQLNRCVLENVIKLFPKIRR